jgi:small subunit ribosomal protein S17e
VGIEALDRIRRFSEELLKRYPDRFSADYDKNKQALNELTVIQSKMLRNQIAGYLAKMLSRTEESEETEEIVEEAKAE